MGFFWEKLPSFWTICCGFSFLPPVFMNLKCPNDKLNELNWIFDRCLDMLLLLSEAVNNCLCASSHCASDSLAFFLVLADAES